ncbi:MAG TPA: DUF2254 domain-containing protein [Acidimicrobiales bacterium]|nr:DUF2254 domain-containing protein [Acidimicrobiales bacterium]
MSAPQPPLLARILRAARVEQLRASLWFVPAVAVAGAVVVAAFLSRVDVGDEGLLSRAAFPGGAESARAILQTIAGSVITVTGVVFSLTVVTLQLASTQFSPRLLRTFLRDVSNQLVLAIFLATFAYCLVVLRGVSSGAGAEAGDVPRIAVTGAYVLGAASVAALVFFIDHIARAIRIDSLMREVNEDTCEVIDALVDLHPGHDVALDVEPGPAIVPSPRSGFIQAVDERRIARAAAGVGAIVHVERPIGDRVIEDAPLARVRILDGDLEVPRPLVDAIQRSVQIGYERTMQEDVAFGLRQLVDVAVKALSPGVNDPTTATHALGHLAHLLVRIARARLGDRTGYDDDRVARVLIPGPSFGEYLDLALDQIRRYGAADAAVMTELLRVVLDVAVADSPGRHREEICEHMRLAVAAAERAAIDPSDLDEVYELRARIEEVIAQAG